MFYFTKKSALCALIISALCGCSKDVEYKPYVPKSEGVRLIVGNEGNYGKASASLTVISYDGTVTNDAFRSINGRALGDVAQGITEIGDNLYVTLNTSRKIEVMNKKTFESVATLETPEATIPTYVAHLGGDSIVVTEKGSKGRLMIFDINKKFAARRVVEGVGGANQMMLTNGKLFIAGAGALIVFDINNINSAGLRKIKGLDEAVFNIAGDAKIVKDKSGNLWVCSSKKLVCVNPATERVVKELPLTGIVLPSGGWGARLAISADGEFIYFTGEINNKGGVLRMPITATEVPTKLLFEYSQVTVQYNMAVSFEGTVFICDALNYSSRGVIREYTQQGEVINSYDAGIIPQYIHFMNR